MKWLKWIITPGLVALAAVIAWMAVGQPRLWQLRVEDRVYRIGYENEPPVHFTGKDGKATGVAVELVAEAARRRGIQLHWQEEPVGSEIALRAHRVDLWPLITITPERKGVVYITGPYLEGDTCLIVRSESTYTRFEELCDDLVRRIPPRPKNASCPPPEPTADED